MLSFLYYVNEPDNETTCLETAYFIKPVREFIFANQLSNYFSVVIFNFEGFLKRNKNNK